MPLGQATNAKKLQEHYNDRLKMMKDDESVEPPPITYKSQLPDVSDKAAGNTATIKVPLDPTTQQRNWNTANTTERTIAVFENGNPEQFCHFRYQLDLTLEQRGQQNNLAAKKSLLAHVLGPSSKKKFDSLFTKEATSNGQREAGNQLTDSQVFDKAMNKFAHSVFRDSKNALRRQKKIHEEFGNSQ